jgi:signal transduction histidine kinase
MPVKARFIAPMLLLRAEAQQANRLKDEFLATLSHELRTPLNVIAGRSRMLTAAPDVETARQHAEVIDRNSATLARLVDDLLDVSRMAIGQVRLERQAVDLPAVVSAAVQAVQSAAEARGVNVRVAVAPAPALTGDPTRIQQIVWNLLTNAVKFTPPDGLVEVTAVSGDGDVTLTVRYSGQGLDPAALPHVFEMFWQAEPLSARKHGGLGLGLSIVRTLVELHGGRVRAESAGAGQGAAFIVTLPCSLPAGG